MNFLYTLIVFWTQLLYDYAANEWDWLPRSEPSLWKYCQYHDNLIFSADPQFCPNVNCWESQLTDRSRYWLTIYYNQYRIKVTVAKCSVCSTTGANATYENMNYMEYHWYLEQVAQNLLKKTCQFSIPPTSIELNVSQIKDAEGLFKRSSIFEYAATSMPYLYDTQEHWMDDLPKFLDPDIKKANTSNLNILGDWQSNLVNFRRGTVFHFGCAIAVRDGVTGTTGVGEEVTNQPIIHLLCVYASWLPFYTLKGNPYEEMNCNQIDNVGLDETAFLKQGRDHITVCRRETHIFEALDVLFYAETPVRDVPCMVYEPEFISLSIYKDPCPGQQPTKTWQNADLKVSNDSLKVTFPFTNDTEIPKTPLAFILAPFVSPEANIMHINTTLYQTSDYDPKFCFIMLLIFFVVLSFFLLALVFVTKYLVEERYYLAEL